MKIETTIHPNCSDYTIYLEDLKPDSILKIKELEKDLKDLWEWSAKERKTRPTEPSFNGKNWGVEYKKWKELPVVKTFYAEDKKRWARLTRKYKVDKEDIFETTIHGFKWTAANAVQIDGYLNEDNLVSWLEKIAKAENIRVDGE